MVSLVPTTPKPPDAANGMPSSFKQPPSIVMGSFNQIASSYGQARLEPAEEDGGVFSCLVYGDKDAGKTGFPLGYEKPKGSRTLILSYDLTSLKSLKGRFGQGWMDRTKTQVVEMVRPNRMVGYPGFTRKDPQTAMVVWSETMAQLEKARAAGDVGLIVLDHFQKLYSEVCMDAIFAVRKIDPLFGRAEYSDWDIRTKLAHTVQEAAANCLIPGGGWFMTGYGPQEKTVPLTDENGDPILNAKGKQKIGRQTVWPKWLGSNLELARDILLTVELSVYRPEGIGTPSFFAEVVSSKMQAQFPVGHKCDWTGGSIKTLLDSVSLQDPAVAEAVTA